MTGTLAILNRELVARRDLLLVAVAAAGIALLMPLLPGLEGYGADDVREVSSSVLALVIGWGMAIGFGASIFGSELSQGRLGFFFARPVPGFSVWLGRFSAILLLTYLCELVVLLPAILWGRSLTYVFSHQDVWVLLTGFVVAPLFLVLLAHAGSIMFRARTAWLFLDLTGFLAVGVASWLCVRPFVLFRFAKDALFVSAGALILAFLIGLAVAGAVGVIVGRTDLRRTHGALSLTLWILLTLSVGATGAYSSWLRSFTPADLDRVDVLSVGPTGDWIEILGSAPGHLDVERRFLVSAADSRWLALPMGQEWFYDNVSFAENGLRAVWLSDGIGEEPRSVRYADLGGTHPEISMSNIVVPPATHLEISSDGNLLALVEERTLSVYELSDERLVRAVRLPEILADATIFFLNPETIRLYAKDGGGSSWSIHIAEIAVSTGELIRLGAIEVPGRSFWTIFDANLERMVICSRTDDMEEQRSLRAVYDARSGEIIQEIDQGFPQFLSDGRLLAMGKNDDDALQLREFAPDERVVLNREIEMPEAFRFGAEMLPGQVAFSREVGFEGQTRLMRTDLVDVDSGVVRPIGEDLRIVTRGFRWKAGDLGAVFWYVTGFEGARLLERSDGSIVRWDPVSGELFHVVGGAK